MNRKKTKLLSILLAGVLAFQSAGISATAASDSAADLIQISGGDLSEMNLADLTGGLPSDDVSEETALEHVDGADADVDAQAEDSVVGVGDAADAVEDADGTTDGEELGTTEGNTPPSTEISVELSSLFPGLPESYTLSKEQLSNKELLAQHTDDIAPFMAEDNTRFYAKSQIIYMAESEEDAQTAAEAFGGTLGGYDMGIALIVLPENRTVAQAVLAASSDSINLPAVWPNYYKELYADYTDPALSDKQVGYQWQHEAVGSRYAWDAGYKGQGVKVGVIDTGIRNSHEEFSGRIASHLAMQDTTAVASTTDTAGHGTHVSGIVAANLNGKGGAGIAPEASLYVYDVLNTDGSIDSYATARAIRHAIDSRLDIINMSYGSPMFDGTENLTIQEAYTAGIALFAAAGNDATNSKSYPASYSNVCSIASLQQDGKKSSFTNFNEAVDLAFPGSDIYSTVYDGDSAYGYKDGTSMACPVAAGVAAVILSGADQVSELKGKTGKARVDALYKVMRSKAKKSPSAGTGAGTTYLPSVFNLTVDNAAAVPATPKFSLNSKQAIADTFATLNITSDTKTGVSIYYTTDGKKPALKNGAVTTGELYTGAITIGGAKKVTVKAIAVNLATGKSSKLASATYTFAPNPIGVELTAKGNVTKLAPGGSLTLKAQVLPSYAVSNKVVWSVSPADKGVTVKNGKVSVAKDATPGSYSVRATAVDKKGNAYAAAAPGIYDFTVISSEARVKSIKLKSKTASLYAKGASMNLADGITVTYADGSAGTADDVVWSSSDPSIVYVVPSKTTQEPVAGMITGRKAGTATITATANDGTGKSASCKVTVKQTATGLKLEGASKLAAGKSMTLKATISPSNVSSKTLEWTVSGGSGVTVKNGKVSAAKNASGTCTVTATTTDAPEGAQNQSASIQITIVNDPIKSITVQKTLNLFTTAGNSNAPTSALLSATVNGGDPSAVTYTSSAPGIASVDPTTGLVRAKSSGKAKITCAATDGSGKKSVCNVTVSVPMSRLTIVPAVENDGYVSVGSSLKLTTKAGTSFGNPQNTKVKWIVPDGLEDCYSVSSAGVIKPKASITNRLGASESGGKVKVIAQAMDGSGVSAEYTFVILRKIKTYEIKWMNSIGFVPTVTYDNGMVDNTIPYTATISAPKNKHIAFSKGNYNEFFLYIDEVTTNKSKNSLFWFASDGVKVSVKLKLQTGNKTASKTYIVIHTKDGGNIMAE
ncbi:MAG: S8 family serine peptidase [Muribaculum sp.]|nr:S8 family serine peptidase [Muribaculum sp.]